MKIISVSQMRKLDQKTIDEAHIPGTTLMKRAGIGIAEKVLEFLKSIDKKHVLRLIMLAGKGNNGGDVYVSAEYLAKHTDIHVVIYSICPLSELKGDARFYADLLPENIQCVVKNQLSKTDFKKGDIILDGLLGTGFHGLLRTPYDNWISTVNSVRLPIISVDIPSGLNGDTGMISVEAIEADLTVTIGLPKKGLIAGLGPKYCGQIKVVDIGIPNNFIEETDSDLHVFTEPDAYSMISKLPVSSYKNSNGSVLIIGGSSNYKGAPFLAGKSALRSGAGIVTVAVPTSAGIIQNSTLSLITREIPDSGKGVFSKESIPVLKRLAESADCIVIGPGMTNYSSCLDMLEAVLKLDKIFIIDADAINLVAQKPEILKIKNKYIFTPHPGEANRLFKSLGLSDYLKKDRITQADKLSEMIKGLVVLKGHRTVISAEEQITSINSSGSPSLATAGSGDVLTGIIAATVINYDSLYSVQSTLNKKTHNLKSNSPVLKNKNTSCMFNATALAVFIHGLAGEISNNGKRGLIADDLIELIPIAMKKISPFA